MRQRQRSGTTPHPEAAGTDFPAVLFDLDGTLIDSNYQHVAAWSEALRSAQIVIPEWKIHRRIGMSGKSFLKELLRELPRRKTNPDLDQLESRHDSIFRRSVPRLCSLPGANQLLNHLARHHVRMAIATTGGQAQTSLLIKHSDLPRPTEFVTGEDRKSVV